MFSGDATSGMTFRYNFILVAVVSIAIVLLTAFIYQIVQRAMLEEVRIQITEEVTLMERIAQDEGPDALAQIGFFNNPRNFTSTNLFGLFDTAGARLAGNLTAAPETPGWVRKEFQGLYPEPNGPYLIFSKPLLGGLTVSVGRNLTPITNVLRVLLVSMLSTAAAASAIRIFVSYLISRRTFARLDQMTGTLERVADGDLDARVAVGGGTEQFDKAARLINGHLDQLKRVVETNKNTINAIAHDLRSPLNRVSILLNEMEAAGDTATAEVKFDEIRSELASLTGIFDTILRISRLRSDNGSQGFAPIDLTALVREIGEIYAPVVEDQGDTLIVDLNAAETLQTVADPRMIRQMLVNLIENATNHCPEGVTIALRARPGDDGGAVVEISDTGPGIPASQRRAVLEPFRRLDTNRSTPGTGLGLALIAAIAERHGAEVQLDDNNPGLVVRVVFPPRGEQAKLANL